MIFNLNFDPKVISRIAVALEKLTYAYLRVHAAQLRPEEPVDKKVGVTYYQSDRDVYLEEQKAKAKAEMEFD